MRSITIPEWGILIKERENFAFLLGSFTNMPIFGAVSKQ
jgi:hypothetical protein